MQVEIQVDNPHPFYKQQQSRGVIASRPKRFVRRKLLVNVTLATIPLMFCKLKVPDGMKAICPKRLAMSRPNKRRVQRKARGKRLPEDRNLPFLQAIANLLKRVAISLQNKSRVQKRSNRSVYSHYHPDYLRMLKVARVINVAQKQRHLQYPIPDGIFPRPPAYVISSIAKTALFSLYTSIDQLMSLFLVKLRQRRRK